MKNGVLTRRLKRRWCRHCEQTAGDYYMTGPATEGKYWVSKTISKVQKASSHTASWSVNAQIKTFSVVKLFVADILSQFGCSDELPLVLGCC